MKKTYIFTVELAGNGETPEEAWLNAVQGLAMAPGPVPEEYEVEDENAGLIS